MLPPAARLRRRPEFTDVLRTGLRAGRPTVVVHVAPAVESSSTRVGFVVGKAVGGAVVRNQVRRRLRHVVRDRLSHLDEQQPACRIVVRALPPSATATTAQLAGDVDAALRAAQSAQSRVAARRPDPAPAAT